MAFLLVKLGSQAAQVLGILGLLVDITGLTLAHTLVVVEALAVLLLPTLDISAVVSCGELARVGWVGRTRSEAVFVVRFCSYIPGRG